MSGNPSWAEGSRGAEPLATLGEVAPFLRVPPKTLYRLGPVWHLLGCPSRLPLLELPAVSPEQARA